MKKMRMRALVCLLSFCAGLFTVSAGPLMAQSNMSPQYRSANPGVWNNPYYRAMNTPYYNPNLYGSNQYTYNQGGYRPGSYPQNYYVPQNNITVNTYTGPIANGNQRYNRTYGNRYNPSYYGGTYGRRGYELPGVIGAVAGLAIGASCFGLMGALVGGVGGWFVGDWLGRRFLPQKLGYPGSYQTYGGYYTGESKVPMYTGIAGAVAGAMLTMGMGPLSMLLAGTVGFFTARYLLKLISPQFYYYGVRGRPFYNPPSQHNYYYAPESTQKDVPAAPTGSVSDDLAGLQQSFFRAMNEYRETLSSSDTEAKMAARRKYEEARGRYMEARKKSLSR